MITTNNEKFYNKLLRLRSHGIEKGNFDFPNISHGDSSLQLEHYAFTDGVLNPWYYEMQSLGFNYRITDFQAALAFSQLKKFEKFISRGELLQACMTSYWRKIATYSQSNRVLEKRVPFIFT